MTRVAVDSPAVSVNRLSCTVGGDPGRVILRDLELALHAGKVASLVGPNGVGKTTLARVLAGIEPPSAGEVCRVSLTNRPNASMVFQEVDESLLPWASNLSNVTVGLEALGRDAAEARQEWERFAEEFDLDDLLPMDQLVSRSSGGQRQMVALVRSAIVRPALLVLDEALSRIDPVHKGRWIRFVRRFARRFGTAVFLVTHDLDLAILVSDVVFVMTWDKNGSAELLPPILMEREQVFDEDWQGRAGQSYLAARRRVEEALKVRE